MNIFNDPRYPTTWTNDEILAAKRREQALNDAYAAGRADEREEWAPVLEALRAIVNRDLTYFGGYVTDGAISMEDIQRAREAIAKLTGEQA